MEDWDLTSLLDLLVLMNWTWLLVSLLGLSYAIRSLLRREDAERLRRVERIDSWNTLELIRAEVKRIVSVYRIRKGRLLIAVLALNAFVGLVAVLMVQPVRPQVTLYFLLTAGAMLVSGMLLSGVCYLIDSMDRAVEHYLDAHPVPSGDMPLSPVAQADHEAVAALASAAEALHIATELHKDDEARE